MNGEVLNSIQRIQPVKRCNMSKLSEGEYNQCSSLVLVTQNEEKWQKESKFIVFL